MDAPPVIERSWPCPSRIVPSSSTGPGCGFCARLRSTLGDRADEAQWINIWQDKEAAAFVRSINDGNETVPTVVLDGIPVTNPNPQVVLDKLAA